MIMDGKIVTCLASFFIKNIWFHFRYLRNLGVVILKPLPNVYFNWSSDVWDYHSKTINCTAMGANMTPSNINFFQELKIRTQPATYNSTIAFKRRHWDKDLHFYLKRLSCFIVLIDTLSGFLLDPNTANFVLVITFWLKWIMNRIGGPTCNK